MKSIASVELVTLTGIIGLIESNQVNKTIYYMCIFLDITSVVYIWRDQGQNYLFFFSCILREETGGKKQNTVERTCTLSIKTIFKE